LDSFHPVCHLANRFPAKEYKPDSDKKPAQCGFVKVVGCLYRYQSTGSYYALVKRGGKQFRKSLNT